MSRVALIRASLGSYRSFVGRYAQDSGHYEASMV